MLVWWDLPLGSVTRFPQQAGPPATWCLAKQQCLAPALPLLCSAIYIVDLIMGFHQGIVVRWDNRAVIVRGELEGGGLRGLARLGWATCCTVGFGRILCVAVVRSECNSACGQAVHTSVLLLGSCSIAWGKRDAAEDACFGVGCTGLAPLGASCLPRMGARLLMVGWVV